VSIHKLADGVFELRWREGGRNKSLRVHGSHELAKRVLRKKMSVRDENRHLDIKKDVNYRMSALIDRYWNSYGVKKRSASREKSVLDGIRSEMGRQFIREIDGITVSRWYEALTAVKNLSPGTAVRHFNVMHHMMKKAATIWSKETGIDRNPADQVEVRRPDDQRDRYLSAEELTRLKQALDEKTYRKGTKEINQTFYRLRLIVLIALTTGMRSAEVFGLKWSDLMYSEGLIAVRAKLKGGKMRYVPMLPELASELRRYPVVIGEDRIFPPKVGATGERQRVEGSFEDLLERAEIEDFRFHDLRHTFCFLVHDEWRRSLRTRQDTWPLEHQNDRTVCQAGSASHRQDRQYRSGNLEAVRARQVRARERRLTDVRLLFGQLKLNVFGYY
jgi:integrase